MVVVKQGSSSYTKIRPMNIGGDHDIPDDICAIAQLDRNDVIAWTTLDSDYQRSLGWTTCCRMYPELCYLPCFWPTWIMLFPCLCSGKVSEERKIKNTYWVLTESDLIVIIKNHDHPGCYHVRDDIKSIPYDTITYCTTIAPSSGCLNCSDAIPAVSVVSRSSTSTSSTDSSPTHVAVAYGLAGYDWFVTEILSRRDALIRNKNHQQQHEMAMSNKDRGTDISNEFAESRIQ
jgi:hypothetical protein